MTPPRERGDVSLWLIENNKPSTYSCNFTDASLISVIGYNEYFSFRYSHNFELFRAVDTSCDNEKEVSQLTPAVTVIRKCHS